MTPPPPPAAAPVPAAMLGEVVVRGAPVRVRVRERECAAAAAAAAAAATASDAPLNSDDNAAGVKYTPDPLPSPPSSRVLRPNVRGWG